MALLDQPYLAQDERSYDSNPRSAFPRGNQGQSGQVASPAKLSSQQRSTERESVRSWHQGMPTPVTGSSAVKTSVGGPTPTSQPLAPPPGLPRSSSTAELVALGFIPTDGSVRGDSISAGDTGGYNGDNPGRSYDPRPRLSSSGSGNEGMVGSTNGVSAGLEATGSGGGGGQTSAAGGGVSTGVDMSGTGSVTNSTGTGSAGGMGLGLRNHSLTNLANMVRSQSELSFQTDLFNNGGGGGGGSGGRMMASTDVPAWGSYPANLDKAGGGGTHAFTMSPATGSLSAGSRGLRPPRSSSGGSGVDTGGVDASPTQFAGRGTAPTREVERGVPAWSSAMRSSQRRSGAGSAGMDHGGVPSGRAGGGAPSGLAMVYNRSDTDLVASFSRLGFGQGGISRWSPHMSPTASPLGAPLLEEDPLDLELEENTHEGGDADTFGTSLRPGGRRGMSSANAGGMGAGLPRHASYPSLAVSHGGYGMDDLVHGAFEDLTTGDSNAGVDGEGAGGVGGLNTSGMSSSGLSSGNLSSSGRRMSGRVTAGGGTGGSGMSGTTSSGSLSAAGGGVRGDGYSPSTTSVQGTLSTLSPATHALSPVSAAQRPPQGMRHGGADASRGAQASRHRSSAGGMGGGGGAGGVHNHRPHPHSPYDQGRGGGIGGVDGVMMSDGRFVPTSQLMAEGGGHPGMMYGDGGGYGGPGGGYDGMNGGGGGGQMDVPWGAQDPVSLYQALLMKQSLAAAHASGMRFPSMMPTNGMAMNMVDMAALAAAAQAAAGRGGGGYGGGYGGHPGAGMDFGRRDGGPMRGGGGRGGGGMDIGGYMGGPVGGMPDGRSGMMGIGRGGGMYDIVEDIGDGNVYQVQFKRSTRNFLLGKTCQRDLQVGDYVKVEADRGEDLGMVVQVFPVPEAGRPLPATAGQKRGFGQFEKEHIIRAATEDEVQMVKDKMRDEERVLEVCRTKVLQRSLPMRVMDAEFQYDRHKLTFFFEAEGRIDFRELVRDLFSLYKTRIWMQQLEPETAPSVGHMASPYSPQGGGNMMDSHAGGGPMGPGMSGGMGMGGPML